jgi:polysaccharide export outer membrane protein
VPLSPSLVRRLEAEQRPPVFTGRVLDAKPAEIRVGVGDILTVTIFESQAGGLFIPQEAGSRPGNFVQLPPQQVDRAGNISVPFGGTVRAAGRTPADVQQAIQQRLAGRALDPQVVVSLTERRSNYVSVLGDVASSQRFALDPQGDRLLSALARAGGPRYPGYESMVAVQRDTEVQRALLSEVELDPRQNIALQPGDVVLVTREPRYFTSLGAMGQNTAVSQINRRFSFDDTRLSMADALGRVGGLTDDRANPEAVFLFRLESAQTLRNAGVTTLGPSDVPVPTVYVANFLEPGTFFLASGFPMRNADILYTSNAPATELAKFLNVVLPGSSSGAAIRTVLP